MKSNKQTFSALIQSFQYKYDLDTVFRDFITMTVCAFGYNPITKKSYDEDLYMETIGKYKDDDLRHQFPLILNALILEMEERFDSSTGNDVLGEYFEQNFRSRNKGQFFTPWHICEFMALSLGDKTEKALRVLDPCCGGGRMLLAGAKHLGRHNYFYGIDIDHTCVKMAAINLFLNGIFHSEVMCADALALGDFRMSYKISLLPFGIFRISEKEKSPLWNSYQYSLKNGQNKPVDLKLPSESGDSSREGSQLSMF